MRSSASCFDELRAYLETVPLIDCHDHTQFCDPKYEDPLSVVVNGYFHNDINSASSDAEAALIVDGSKSLEERWPVFEKAWQRTCHTGYAQVTRRLLREFYGIEEVTLETIKSLEGRMLDLSDQTQFEALLDKANIKARIVDIWPDNHQIMNGTLQLSCRGRLAISLPAFHKTMVADEVLRLASPTGKTVTSLGEYLEACREIFEASKAFGAVCFKDQSAYSRGLAYTNPTFHEAESVFNRLMADPRVAPGYPEGIAALDDFLFHSFMRMARDMDLPVQIHTGHMAGIRNEITKTNAVQLTSVLELHRDTRFDLFHANWPYSGELLFLAKNYPNVTIDFCWANIIDPIYCQNMFKQALSSVPHGKIHGYGSDFFGRLDRAWAHAAIARDNIGIALADLVDMEYLSLDEARQVGYQWLFGNANDFFRLGVTA